MGQHMNAFMAAMKSVPLTKSDDHIWSATVGPYPPGALPIHIQRRWREHYGSKERLVQRVANFGQPVSQPGNLAEVRSAARRCHRCLLPVEGPQQGAPLNRCPYPPTRLGPYEIKSTLGVGGMGQVYPSHGFLPQS